MDRRGQRGEGQGIEGLQEFSIGLRCPGHVGWDSDWNLQGIVGSREIVFLSLLQWDTRHVRTTVEPNELDQGRKNTWHCRMSGPVGGDGARSTDREWPWMGIGGQNGQQASWRLKVVSSDSFASL